MADIKKILTRVKDYVTQEDTLEKTRAENAEEALQDNIDAEELRDIEEETKIDCKLVDYITSNNRALAKEIEDRITAINSLDLSQVGSDGHYIKFVRQTDGQVAAQAQAFDTTFVQATDNNAPTTKLVNDTFVAEATARTNADLALDDRINALDLAQVGSDGNYIKFVSQEDGKVAVQKQAFDTDMTNATDDNAPTTKNVKDYVDTTIDSLDKAEVGEDGKYIKKIKEDNGIITATLKEFDTLIDNSANNTNTPTTKAVKDYVDSEIDKLDSNVGNNTKVITGLTITNGKITANTERTIVSTIEGDISNIPTDEAVKTYVDNNINELNLTQVGSAGNYIKFVSQEDGQVYAEAAAFYTDTTFASAPNDNAPVASAVKTYADAINTNLQTQIDNLKSVQNVVEVVEHYSDLASKSTIYDENDCIQVIQDENAHNERPSEFTADERPSSIYRLKIVGGVKSWDYVGSYGGDSYTKAQSDARFVNRSVQVNGHALASNISLDKTDVGLGSVDNTSDANKPVSTAQQTALNGKVDKTTTVNGHSLSGNVTVTKADVLLGNVDNTSDANKPISNATQSALNDKADKSTTYTKTEINTKLANIPLTLSYENSELYEVFNDGRTQTVVTAAELKTDMSLDNVTNDRQIKGLASGTTEDHILVFGTDGYTVKDSGKIVTTSVAGTASALDSKLPTELAVRTALDFKEDTANRVSAFQATPDNTHYPTEKLVKDSLDLKATLAANNTFTGENTFSDEVTINDDFYVTGQSDFDNDITVHGDVNITNDLIIDGDITAGSLSATGSSIILGQSDGSVYIRGNTTFTGSSDNDVEVNLDTIFTEGVEFTGSVTYTETIASNVTASTSMADICNLVWSANKAYAAGDIIFYSKALYICNNAISASSQGNSNPATDITNWTKLFTNQA